MLSTEPSSLADGSVSIVIVDDHPLVREGLSRVIAAQPSFRLVAEADSIEQALGLTVEDVDVCTLDLSLPGTSGIDGISMLQQKWPSARILVLTVHGEESHAAVCAKRGAAGFLSKSAPPSEIRHAISALALGGSHFSAPALAAMTEGDGTHLTSREREVLGMLARGQRVTDIARTIGVSVKTISTHKMRLQRKLGAGNTAQIVGLARVQGLLP